MKSTKSIFTIVACFMLMLFVSAGLVSRVSGAAQAEEETIAGMVVKTDKGIVIEADDGDYLAKGSKAQELAKMVGKLVEVTGVITESDKGDTIEVKSFEEIQE